MPSVSLLLLLLFATLTSISIAATILLREALRDWQQPKLRYVDSGTLVALPLPEGKSHHVFISHV